jgi:hypothetical protein
MEFGFASWKDVIEVLLVPVSISFLALLWPTMTAWRRRKNFEYLIRLRTRRATFMWAKCVPQRKLHTQQSEHSEPTGLTASAGLFAQMNEFLRRPTLADRRTCGWSAVGPLRGRLNEICETISR